MLGIESRGRDATGFVAQTKRNEIVLDKQAVPAQDFVINRKGLPKETRAVLLHTRLTTQGSEKNWLNNHPVQSGTVFTTHNGVILNDGSLFKDEKLDRTAEVDSEIIAALLNKYTFDNPEKAFELLRGNFSTASLDIRNPGVVLLAKGGGNPFEVLETKDVVVWASYKKAITDAWGLAIGTPPTKGFSSLSSGSFWLLNGEAVDKASFNYNTGSSRSGWSSQGEDRYDEHWEDWWEYEDGGAYFKRSGGSKTTKPASSVQFPKSRAILDYAVVIAKLRSEGKTACVTYASRKTEKGRAYLDKYGDGKWSYCAHCKTSIAATQFVKNSKDYGDICMDCYILAGTEKKKKSPSLDDFLIQIGIRNEDYEKLEKFADLHYYIHRQALYSVANETGVKITLLEYLLFHAELAQLESSDELLDLYSELFDRYFDAQYELWQLWSQETAEEKVSESAWVTCASGTHKADEECEACNAAGDSCGVEVFSDESYSANRWTCVDCQKSVLGSECLECGTLKPAVHYEQEEQVKKCLLCRRKPKHFLGLTHAWCEKHWSKCGLRGCQAAAVGYLPNSTRRCHVHSRHQKGFIADNDFKARKAAMKKRSPAFLH